MMTELGRLHHRARQTVGRAAWADGPARDPAGPRKRCLLQHTVLVSGLSGGPLHRRPSCLGLQVRWAAHTSRLVSGRGRGAVRTSRLSRDMTFGTSTNTEGDGGRLGIPAIRVRQWLPAWDDMSYGAEYQARPKAHFYVLSVAASTLKTLSGIQRRDAESGQRRVDDLGIQRRHDPERSTEIREFVRNGFPWSDLSERQRKSGDFEDLKKPGWLPTAIVVNILATGDQRGGRTVGPDDLIEVEDEHSGTSRVLLPSGSDSGTWNPSALHPIEVIDGQHRLWAFRPGEFREDFELPVVAFHGLDLSWQAYLFWTINIKPKRINASLAFDLYPLLRTVDWLERFEGPTIYREARAQELTELLWAHPDSPWYRRINMLGERGLGGVTQAAWIRSLTHSFVKASEGPGVRVGGLFGAPVGDDDLALPWTREQQAAFLIFAWATLAISIKNVDNKWASSLRTREVEESDAEKDNEDETFDDDQAFVGRYTLLNTDQGVRAFLQVINDMCFVLADELALRSWPMERADADADLEDVTKALADLDNQPVASVVIKICDALAGFDWRTSSHPSLSEEERTLKGAFRGSGGYRELRRQLLAHLERKAEQPVSGTATELRDRLNLR
jgi:hypothetical protein